MNETWVTLIGNVVAEPRTTVLADGTFLASFRLASTSRRFDRTTQVWRDQDTVYVTVLCWRQLGENVADSLFRGAPVLVTGRLATKTYDSRTGERRLAVEVEAAAVGLDLTRGKGSLFRGNRARLTASGSPVPAAGATPDVATPDVTRQDVTTPDGAPAAPAAMSVAPTGVGLPTGEPRVRAQEPDSVDAA